MKIISGLLAAISGFLGGSSAQSAPSAAAAKASAANQLAWNLYRSIGARAGNVFISPASLTAAVGLLFEGSSGATRKQAKKFLALEQGVERGSLVPSALHSFENPGALLAPMICVIVILLF